MKISVSFPAGEDFGSALGKLRDVLKTKAGLAGLQVRKQRPHSVLVSGADSIYSAQLLLLSLGYACTIVGESEPPNASEVEQPKKHI